MFFLRVVVVFSSIAHLLDLLPELSPLIHDDSEKVRLCLVELLETVKQIKGMQ
jgi:hypothetical protein